MTNMHHYRQVAINWGGFALTLTLILLLGFSLWALVNQAIPEGNRDPFLVIVGMIVTKVGSIVDWHYGSSSSSKRQEETISNQSETIKTAQAALTPNTKADVTLEPGQTATVAAEDDRP